MSTPGSNTDCFFILSALSFCLCSITPTCCNCWVFLSCKLVCFVSHALSQLAFAIFTISIHTKGWWISANLVVLQLLDCWSLTAHVAAVAVSTETASTMLTTNNDEQGGCVARGFSCFASMSGSGPLCPSMQAWIHLQFAPWWSQQACSGECFENHPHGMTEINRCTWASFSIHDACRRNLHVLQHSQSVNRQCFPILFAWFCQS